MRNVTTSLKDPIYWLEKRKATVWKQWGAGKLTGAEDGSSIVFLHWTVNIYLPFNLPKGKQRQLLHGKGLTPSLNCLWTRWDQLRGTKKSLWTVKIKELQGPGYYAEWYLRMTGRKRKQVVCWAGYNFRKSWQVRKEADPRNTETFDLRNPFPDHRTTLALERREGGTHMDLTGQETAMMHWDILYSSPKMLAAKQTSLRWGILTAF